MKKDFHLILVYFVHQTKEILDKNGLQAVTSDRFSPDKIGIKSKLTVDTSTIDMSVIFYHLTDCNRFVLG